MDNKEREKMEEYFTRREGYFQILFKGFTALEYKAIRSYEKMKGFEVRELFAGIKVYKNMLAHGYSKEEALAVSEMPEEITSII